MYGLALFNQIIRREKNRIAKISEYLSAANLNKNSAVRRLAPMMNTHSTFSLQPSASIRHITAQVSRPDFCSNSTEVMSQLFSLKSAIGSSFVTNLSSAFSCNHKQKVADHAEHNVCYKNSFHMSFYHLNPYYLNPSLILGEI